MCAAAVTLTLPLTPTHVCAQQPKIGGEVVPHQDSSFIYTEPMSCVGLWWALEEATKDNGCLWAAPEEHKKGLRRRFFVKDGGWVRAGAPGGAQALGGALYAEVLSFASWEFSGATAVHAACCCAAMRVDWPFGGAPPGFGSAR